MTNEKYGLIKDAIRSDRSLSGREKYFDWTPNAETITMDDDFTIEELRQIADYMEANKQ